MRDHLLDKAERERAGEVNDAPVNIDNEDQSGMIAAGGGGEVYDEGQEASGARLTSSAQAVEKTAPAG